jgi:hypothetical protein
VNPFREFTHFIGLFVPGTLLYGVLLSVASLLAHKDLFQNAALFGGAGLFIMAIVGTALGVILDEARHSSIEDWLTDLWTKRGGYDPDKLKQDFVGYIPPMTPELYTLIRDEGYYFYEFDVNMGFVLAAAAFALPFYLHQFHPGQEQLVGVSTRAAVAFISLLVSALCVGLWFGSSAYKYSVRSFVTAMENLSPGFEQQVKLPSDGTKPKGKPPNRPSTAGNR